MPQAEALAVLAEEIQAVGSNEEIMTLSGPETQVIDLQGKALLPGFVDPHTHPFDLDSPEALDESQQYTLAGGVTTVGDANASPSKVVSFLQALESTDLRIRTSLYLAYNTKCKGLHPDDWFLEYPRDLAPNLRFAGVKIIGDPAGPNNRCGWAPMSVPLPNWIMSSRDTGTFGDLLLDVNEMAGVISENQARGYQVIIHARGDVTVETALNAIEDSLAGESNTFRHRIEHNDFIRPDQLARYGELGVLPTIRGRPVACLSIDTFSGFSGFGPEAEPWYRIGRSLIDANPGLPIAWHGDTTTNGRRPIQDLYDWVTRKQVRPDGTVCEPPEWLAAEAITVEEALRLMTINGAYALFMEDEVGSLKPGKLADLIVLSDNPLTMDPDALKDLEVLMTMVGGHVEYCGQENICPDLPQPMTQTTPPLRLPLPRH